MASQSPVVTAIVHRTADLATVAWAHDGAGDLATLPNVDAAVAAAVALRNIAALQGASTSTSKVARKAASAGLHRLKSAGVVVVDKVEPPRAYTLQKEDIEPLLAGFMSVPDENGDIEVILTVANERGSAIAGFVLGGWSGLREMRVTTVSRSAVREVWRTLGRNRAAEVPFHAALHYVQPFGAGHADWPHFVRLLPPGVVQSAQLLDPLAHRLSGQPPEPGSITRWMPNPDLLDEDVLETALEPLIAVATRREDVDEDAQRGAIDRFLNSVADAALTAPARARLTQHLELTLAALWLSGWDRHHTVFVDILAAVASGKPGSAIPAVEACVKYTLAQRAMQVGG